MGSNDLGIININVGVMGHIDSGKTSVVRALSTHLSTASLDKHPHSRERGITMDLGFSSFKVLAPESFQQAGFREVQFTLVDCPGHASLIKTVMGGAQIIDLIILVIDITKGIQTQTAECLVIGEITTKKLIVVLNKTDLVPEAEREERISRAIARVKKALSSTSFHDAKFVAVSACPGGHGKMGAGAPIDESEIEQREGSTIISKVQASNMQPLIDELASTIELPNRSQKDGKFVFAVDHTFPIKGHGTVATGTVLSGACRVQDALVIPGMDIDLRVKSIQMFKKSVQRVSQGDRAGLCLTNLPPDTLGKGLIASRGVIPILHGAVALVKKVPFFTDNCTSLHKFHISVGHSKSLATCIFFGYEELRSNNSQSGEKCPKEQPICTVNDSSHDFVLKNDDKPYIPNVAFSFKSSYQYQDKLIFRAKSKGASDQVEITSSEDLGEWQWVALLFDAPIYAPFGSLLIGSRLDSEKHENKCRIAFHGKISCPLPSNTIQTLRSLNIYKYKCKVGFIDRIEGQSGTDDSFDVIGRDLFHKSFDMGELVGLYVYTEDGFMGKITSSFGKTGKFKCSFASSQVPSVFALDTIASIQNQTRGVTENMVHKPVKLRKKGPLYLFYKQYMFDPKRDETALADKKKNISLFHKYSL